jgi:hypothetical protein
MAPERRRFHMIAVVMLCVRRVGRVGTTTSVWLSLHLPFGMIMLIRDALTFCAVAMAMSMLRVLHGERSGRQRD